MEQKLVEILVGKFEFLADKVRIQRSRRIVAEIDAAHFEDVLIYAMHNLQFTILCTITGLDEGQTMGFIYHLAREDGIMLNLKLIVPKNDLVLKTITHYFPNAEIYERELVDLLGVKVEGLLEGNRYPLPDSWPQGEYPLRKDWKSSKNINPEVAKNA
jgi:Ni,Fe-hydrogenase III component G